MLSYIFKDEFLRELAFTHSSYANERGISSNERLEFLGDAVLGLAMSEILYNNEEGKEEGDLTKIRSSFVCEENLYNVALKIGLDSKIRYGNSINAKTKSSLADGVEALIGAIFLDAGYEVARDYIKKTIYDSSNIKVLQPKSYLKEFLESKGIRDIEYVVVEEYGKDHNKTFVVECRIEGVSMGKGIGRRKKEAEKKSAEEALIYIRGCYET